jgi:altronate dehydratase small subunit
VKAQTDVIRIEGGGNKVKRAIRIDPKDNTATALDDIKAGDTVTLDSKSGHVGEIKARRSVPFGHKLALAHIGKGEKVIKYGEVIGLAAQPINKWDYVHTHNVESALLPPPKEGK